MKYIKRNDNVSKNINCQNEVSPIVAQILFARGFVSDGSSAELQKFMSPNFNDLYDPYRFKDMDIAVSRIRLAIERHEQIVIFGDYDCDGVMASSILCLELYRLGASVNVYIPSRKEGYGLNNAAIERFAKDGVSLIVTVDCGINAVECVQLANSYNIDVIITDHHEPDECLPDAICVLDAKVASQTYPFKELCGAGVAGKLVQALSGFSSIKRYLDLIAIATIADLVPLIDENRILVSYGLKLINWYPRPSIQSILDYCDIKSPVNSYHIGYKIAPLINACGRLSNALDAVKMVISPSKEIASPYAEKCYQLNEERKKIEQSIVEKAELQIDDANHKSIIVYGENWDIGVIGIAASRLTEKHHCPAIVLTLNALTNEMHGSCRSIPGIDIHSILTCCKRYLSKFGGHKSAAGITLDYSVYNSFKEAFEEEIKKYPDNIFTEVQYYDAEAEVSDITEQLLQELYSFEPCGIGNPKPVIRIKDASYKNLYIIGKNSSHYKVNICDKTGKIQGVAFNTNAPSTLDHLDLIVYPQISNYKGQNELQCNILSCIETSEVGRNSLSSNAVYGYVVKDEPIEILGLSAAKIKQFNDNNIHTVKDLLCYLPRRYMDYRFPKGAEAVEQGEICSMIGTVREVKIYPKVTKAICTDPNGQRFAAVWFHQDYVAKSLLAGTKYIFCGKININQLTYPYSKELKTEIQIIPQVFDRNISKYMALMPVYRQIKGMSIDYLMNSMTKALDKMANVDYLEKNIVDEFNLVSEKDAMIKIHRPSSDKDIELAKRRQAFDQLFRFNLCLKMQNKDVGADTAYKMKNHIIFDLLKNKLPYNLTNDQIKAIDGMTKIMKKERLSALVQGDVGSGKTIVAFFMMCLAHENGYQSCLIAPTEVLASQHYSDLCELVESLGIKVAYLHGGMKAREKNSILKGIASGEIAMVVGTHAVIQDSVKFNSLAVAIVDEQHRFGVNQRNKFLNLASGPHLITMSATPIPRTLSMALFGDHIKTFNIFEKPAGRKEVITKCIDDDAQANDFMYQQIKEGRQCYVICPLIEESKADSMVEVDSVDKEYQKICEYFSMHPEIKIGYINGKMKKDDISAGIKSFVDGEISILVATTIVEVGVNVPNATVIVIKSSERFGLAQAHQLRGRVGRSDIQSYCLLQPNKKDDPKADILCSSSDGFEIAKKDIMLRGTGDFLGTQQTGNNADVMLMLAEPELYQRISELNDRIFADPVLFNKYKYLTEK